VRCKPAFYIEFCISMLYFCFWRFLAEVSVFVVSENFILASLNFNTEVHRWKCHVCTSR
jgi:hypothetical protein